MGLFISNNLDSYFEEKVRALFKTFYYKYVSCSVWDSFSFNIPHYNIEST